MSVNHLLRLSDQSLTPVTNRSRRTTQTMYTCRYERALALDAYTNGHRIRQVCEVRMFPSLRLFNRGVSTFHFHSHIMQLSVYHCIHVYFHFCTFCQFFITFRSSITAVYFLHECVQFYILQL